MGEADSATSHVQVARAGRRQGRRASQPSAEDAPANEADGPEPGAESIKQEEVQTQTLPHILYTMKRHCFRHRLNLRS